LPFGRLAAGNDAAVFIADLHALTSVHSGGLLRTQTHELAVDYLSIYGENPNVTIFRQSDIPLIPRLSWILSSVTPYSLMLRAHSFKDAGNKAADLNMAVFTYPILMAADILAYDIDVVPVGKDQIQHLEMARDIARAFNKTYGQDVFREPAAHTEKSVEMLPGVDGRKMSKSYDNFLGVFDDEKTMKKKIATIKTDSKGLDDPKDPDTCNVFNIARVFATPERLESMRQKYLRGIGYGYGHAKAELFEILSESLGPIRSRHAEFSKDPVGVESRLKEGAKKMNARIEKKMEVVSKLVGI
jgi:tryptophanyl-tRNA synthetase